jgi:hypothetical protein
MNQIAKEKKLSTADLAHAADEPYEVEEEQAQAEAYDYDETDLLFEDSLTDSFQGQWLEIQTKFVDDPRTAVKEADGLVAEVIKGIAEIFAEERAELETQWSQGEDVDTEDLRLILKRYRTFFHRLLAI